jgi:hypothetical protein
VYLPATLPALARLRERGELTVDEAYAVTRPLRDQLGDDDDDDDDEQLSYAAFRLAAEASVRLLGADPAAPRRRVVISVDVPAEPLPEVAAVRPAGPVPLSAVAAVHIDGAAAEPDVAAAVAAGEPEVDHELEWYDASELAQLV